MIDLDFSPAGIEVARASAVPLLLFRLQVANRTPQFAIEHISLQAQIRIEAARREYRAGERDRLSELFGAPADWDRSLRALLWTTVSVAIPPFEECCTVDLPVPCSYDFSIGATKYFDGLTDGEAPLSLLFSGTVFFRNGDGDLQISQIPHHKEAVCRLPAQTWRSLMERYYRDTVWLRVDRGLFDAIGAYKRRSGTASIEDALRALVTAEARR